MIRRPFVRNRKHLINVLVALVSTFAIQPIHAQTTKSAADIIALLEKSGYKYTKVGDGVWEVPGTGKNVKEFGIRLALAEDILIVMVKLAERKDLKLEPPALTKLLELNHKFDSIKIALSMEILYVRMDTHLTLLDNQELKYLLEQIAHAADEIYPQIKQFLPGGK